MNSCSLDNNSATPQASLTIEESRERKVFIKELTPNKYSFLNGKDRIQIKKIWLENVWHHGGVLMNETNKSESKQVIIVVDNMDRFMEWWAMSIGDHSYGSYGNIVLDFKGEEINGLEIQVKKYIERFSQKRFEKVDSIFLTQR